MYVCLVAWCNSNPMAASGAPPPLRFPVWLGIPKLMIPYPLLWEGAVRTHTWAAYPTVRRCPTPPPPRGTALPGAPPRTPPPSQNPPPPRGLRPTVSWGGSWRPKLRGHQGARGRDFRQVNFMGFSVSKEGGESSPTLNSNTSVVWYAPSISCNDALDVALHIGGAVVADVAVLFH